MLWLLERFLILVIRWQKLLRRTLPSHKGNKGATQKTLRPWLVELTNAIVRSVKASEHDQSLFVFSGDAIPEENLPRLFGRKF
jgi:hypothetical protein